MDLLSVCAWLCCGNVCKGNGGLGGSTAFISIVEVLNLDIRVYIYIVPTRNPGMVMWYKKLHYVC